MPSFDDDDKDTRGTQGCRDQRPKLPEKRPADGQQSVLTVSNPSGASRLLE